MFGRLSRSGAAGPMYGENLAWGDRPLRDRPPGRPWLDGEPRTSRQPAPPGLDPIGLGALKGTFGGYRGATVFTADFAGR